MYLFTSTSRAICVLGRELPSPFVRDKKDNPERGWAGSERYSYKELDTLRYTTIKLRLPLPVTPPLTYPSLDVKTNNIFLNWHVDEKDHVPAGKCSIGRYELCFEIGRPKAHKPQDGKHHVAQPRRATMEGCWQTFGGVLFCTSSESTFGLAGRILLNVGPSVAT